MSVFSARRAARSQAYHGPRACRLGRYYLCGRKLETTQRGYGVKGKWGELDAGCWIGCWMFAPHKRAFLSPLVRPPARPAGS